MDDKHLYLLEFRKNANNYKDKFVEELFKFIKNDLLQIEHIPSLLKLFRTYKPQLDKDDIFNEITKSLKHSKNQAVKFFLLLIKYEISLQRDEVKREIRKLLEKEIYKNELLIHDFFVDKKEIVFFEANREDDLFHHFMKWYKMFIYDEELMRCKICDSIKIPYLEYLDDYVCPNKDCSRYNQREYHNHCWSCGAVINSNYNKKCVSCNWYICDQCDKCRKDNKCKDQKPEDKEVLQTERLKIEEKYKNLEQLYKSKVYKYKKYSPRNIINLSRGIKKLDSDDDMDRYIAAYYAHHMIKLQSIISKSDSIIYNNNSVFNDVCIYDWGCGQGLATQMFLYSFSDRIKNLDKIYLIDPADKVLEKAYSYVSNTLSHLKFEANIIKIAKSFEVIVPDEIKSNSMTTINLFSNIIDVDFNLDNLFKLYDKLIRTYNIFYCTSPNYKKAVERTNKFHDHFSKIDSFKDISFCDQAIRTNLYDLNTFKEVSKLVKRYERLFLIGDGIN